jgi:hypothetical protein
MCQLLEEVFERARQLPESERQAIAEIFLEDLENEARWNASFADSQEPLSKWADEIRAEIKAGKVSELGIDEL